MALGAYLAVSLADARQARDEAKRSLAAGCDPAEEKKQKKALAERARDTFRTIAEEYVSKLQREGRAEATLIKVEWLLSFAYPLIGDRSIREIDAPAVLKALQEVEARGRYESARRLRSTIGGVFRYSIATARAENDPTFALRDALTKPIVTPRAAVTDPKAVGALLRAIDWFDGQPTVRTAMQLMTSDPARQSRLLGLSRGSGGEILASSAILSICVLTQSHPTTRAGRSVKLGNESRKERVPVFVKEEASSGEHVQRCPPMVSSVNAWGRANAGEK